MIGFVRRDVHEAHQRLSLGIHVVIITKIEQRLQPAVDDDLHLRDREIRHVAQTDTGVPSDIDLEVLQQTKSRLQAAALRRDTSGLDVRR
jgi:hypothetical protein